MSDKMTFKPLAAAMGTTFAISLAALPIANAAENPFAMTDLGGGYMLAGNHGDEAKVADAGSAEGDAAESEASKGETAKDEGHEGKDGEGKCGEGHDGKDGEGKCGEGKCGG